MTDTAIHIRPAGPDDARNLWQWRNAPEVRAASLETDPIPYDSHRKWFNAALADPMREILIAEYEGRAIGMVRFDADGDVADINILLDPNARGRGLAKPVLAGAIIETSMASSILRATVRAENAASLGLFRSLGFETVKTGDIYEFARNRDS